MLNNGPKLDPWQPYRAFNDAIWWIVNEAVAR